MINKRDREQAELNEAPVTLAVFLDSYNKNIPINFPRASAAILKKFQDTHPALFSQKDGWSVTRHRKKVMDWLSSYRDIS